MRVLQVVNSIVGKKGNIGVRTDHINKTLLEQGYSVDCICRGYISNSNLNYKEKLNVYSMGLLGYIPRILNASRRFLPFFDHRPLDIAIFNIFFLFIFKFKKLEKNFDVVHLWEYSPFIIKFFQKRGLKVILEIPIAPAAYAFNLNRKKKLFKVFKWHIKNEYSSFLLADYLITPSEFVKQEVCKLKIIESKILKVEFGVDINHKVDLSKKINEKQIHFCFAGAINQRKGINELLDVWNDDVFGDDYLHLCGNVNYKMQKRINSIKKDNIITPGFVDIFSYLQKCDVFVFPSWMEGSSKAIYDAMSSGLPSIVTKPSGSIIRDGTDGFIIDAGDKNELFNKMIWFKENPNRIKDMGRNAKDYSKSFSWEGYARRIINIYHQVNN